jgi:hypothetical protein
LSYYPSTGVPIHTAPNPLITGYIPPTNLRPNLYATKPVESNLSYKRDSSGNTVNQSKTNTNTTKSNFANAATSATEFAAAADPKANQESKKKFKPNRDRKDKKFIRSAGGQTWEDDTLAE